MQKREGFNEIKLKVSKTWNRRYVKWPRSSEEIEAASIEQVVAWLLWLPIAKVTDDRYEEKMTFLRAIADRGIDYRKQEGTWTEDANNGA